MRFFDELHERIQHHKSRDFLEAAMAASALAAYADGTVSRPERHSIGNMIVNLHGTNLEVICLGCDDITPAGETLDDLNLDSGAPLCTKCGGLLKPNTISFGQSLVAEDLHRAEKMALSCDLIIAAGSTLVVQPAASFPVIAKNNGALLAIITKSDTPLDEEADFVFHEQLGEFMTRISDGNNQG